jgi:hypothetical protein
VLDQIILNEYNFIEISIILLFSLGGLNPICRFPYRFLEICCKLLVKFRLDAHEIVLQPIVCTLVFELFFFLYYIMARKSC